MEQKSKLMSSMANLIKYNHRQSYSHISLSRTNQEEIFNTLSVHDFNKILANLEDINPSKQIITVELRKITLILLAELLYKNIQLKEKFCAIMNVHPSPGKIIFSNKFSKNILVHTQDVSDVFKVLKEPVPLSENQNYFWCLNLKKTPKAIEYYSKSNVNIDPIDYIVGFVIPKQQPETPPKPIINNFISQNVTVNEEKTNKKMNQSLQYPAQTERDHIPNHKNQSFYEQSNNRMSADKGNRKPKYYQQIIQVKPMENSKTINNYGYIKTPISSYRSQHRGKELNQSLKEPKYIKSLFMNVNTQPMSVTHRPAMSNGATLVIKGNQTTRERPNGHSFIKSTYERH